MKVHERGHGAEDRRHQGKEQSENDDQRKRLAEQLFERAVNRVRVCGKDGHRQRESRRNDQNQRQNPFFHSVPPKPSGLRSICF